MRWAKIGLTATVWIAVGAGLAGAQPSEAPRDVPSQDLAGEPGPQTSASPGTDAAAGRQPPEGQAPAAGASSAPTGPAAGPDAAAASAKPEQGVCNPATDTCLVAETQGREKGHVWARGFTDLRMGDMRVQADALDIYDVEHDGVTSQHMTAEGNVVLLHRQDRLAGTKLSMDLGSGRGTMDNVVGYTDPGVFFTAKSVERIDPKTYRINNGRFTSCCQPQPRWSFSTPRATLKVEDHITAVAAHFDLGVPLTGQQLPLFFMPYFYYPVKPDGRATGFLMPSFNIDFNRGVDVRLGFFLAMGRSADQTFGFERRASPSSVQGSISPKLTHDLRWAWDVRSYGDLHTALFPPSDVSPIQGQPGNKHWDWSLDWNAQQAFTGLFTVKLLANVTSPQDVLTPVNNFYNSNSRIALNLQRTFGWQFLQIRADNRKSVQGRPDWTITRRWLPGISLSQGSRAVGHTGLRWEYFVHFDHLNLSKRIPEIITNSDGSTTTGDIRPFDDSWSRFDIAPSVSLPLATTFLSVTPKLTTRYTHYTESCPVDRPQCGKTFTGGPLARRYAEASVEILGPQFARVFNGPSGYSDLIKHVIGPEIVYVFRAATDNFDRIPRFGDDADNTARTHEIRYGIAQHLWGRRKLANGGTRPFEFLTWTVYQKHYFEPPQYPVDGSFNTYLWDQSGINFPQLKRSPIRSTLRFSPFEQFSLNWLEEYDVNRQSKKVTRLDLGMDIRGPLGRLHANWSRSPERFDQDTQTVSFSEQNTATFSGDLSAGKWVQFGGSTDYTFVDQKYQNTIISPKGFISYSGSVKFDFQCLGLKLIYTRRLWGSLPDGSKNYNSSFQFAIELAHIGSFGMGPGGATGGGGFNLGGPR